ncbi:FadR/GntR family transcriptional regulator [Streptosporangium sandarakinum]|uniref:FadR/GntR family transcriptional regulator n=1 Tax=Streptosporangium sandarakinum TaxID=1260955 RepID=UPI00368315DC
MLDVRRNLLSGQIAELLLTRVRAGEWALGQKLPGETVLAAQLGVGRSTVREAIRELAGKGVLQPRQGAGVFVTALDVQEDWDSVVRRAAITSVIEARVAIESEAAALAAARRTPADLRAARRALRARAERYHDVEELVDADMAFHRRIVLASHNEILLELFDGFVPRLRPAMIEMLRIRPVRSPEDDHTAHLAVVEAVAARDPAAASRHSRAHLESMKTILS